MKFIQMYDTSNRQCN